MLNKIRRYKDNLVMEIINPHLTEKGFVLKKPEPNFWQWEIWIDEVYQYIQLYDSRGCICLIIGNGESHWPGEALLERLENSRTKREQWRYGRFERDGNGQEELFRDIFEDCRDILEKFGDKIIQECVIENKNKVPNHHHFLRFQQEYDELADKYYTKLELSEKDVMETLKCVQQFIKPLQGKEIADVETDLLGAAAAFEKKILNEYGGKKEVCEEFDSSYICEIGKTKRLENVLSSVFFAWEDWGYWESVKNSIERFKK